MLSYDETRRHFERAGYEIGVNQGEVDASDGEELVEAGVGVRTVGLEAQPRYLIGLFAARHFIHKPSRLLHHVCLTLYST